MIVVEEQTDISAFKSFSLDQVSPSTSAKVSQAPSSPPPSLDTNQASAPPVSSAQKQSLTIKTDRVFASPLAKKLVREANQNLAEISTALDSRGSGPNNRLVASDVRKALDILSSRPAPSTQKVSQATVQSQERILSPPVSSFPTSPYSDFELTPSAQELGSRLAATKQTVPHYYVSVEINLKDLLGLRDKLLQQFAAQKKSKDSENNSLSVLDFLVKAAALAVHQVPDVNASWMETFVRRYEQVDINLVMGSGSSLAAPVLRDVSSRGLSSISEEISRFENSLFSADASSFLSDGTKMAPGTLSIHNLGGYGVKSAAPIILPNQACALAFGSIVETVIPSKQEGKEWEVAPIMIATLSCDHRVVDGAVSAQYLAAFKQLVESPMNLLL
jgi:pyruvate dehydrogenase E2 component (dihydrolipoamide acetyltransferase)